MEYEARKPIEIVCPHCGTFTTILFYEEFSCQREGLVCYSNGIDMVVSDAEYTTHYSKFNCVACSYRFDREELEGIAQAARPITEQLKMEGGIDLFENFWGRDTER